MPYHGFLILEGILFLFHFVTSFQLTLTPPFLSGHRDGTEDWSLSGSALIVQDYIQLTSAAKSLHGDVWSKRRWNSKDWQAEFSIAVCPTSMNLLISSAFIFPPTCYLFF